MTANRTLLAGICACSSTARATRSGSEPGPEIAKVLPFMSSIEPISGCVNNPYISPGKVQPTTFTSAPREAAMMALPGFAS